VNYRIKIRRSAQKSLARIPLQYQRPIIRAIEVLSREPRPKGCKKLVGRDAWRLRIGNYRVIYEIEDRDSIIVVVIIGHRKTVYE